MSHSVPSIEESPENVQRVVRWYERVLIKLLSWIMGAWFATLRLNVSERFREVALDTTRSNVFLLWHNRLFMGSLLYKEMRRTQPVYAIVSASKDGAFATALAAELGVRAVRGSSSRRALQSLREMLDVLKNNCDVAITPDGPRGPLYSMSASAALLLRHTHARIVIVACSPHRAWRLKSWDGFYLPKPFSTIDIDSEILEDSLIGASTSDYEFRDLIKKRYDALTVDIVPHPCPESTAKRGARPPR